MNKTSFKHLGLALVMSLSVALCSCGDEPIIVDQYTTAHSTDVTPKLSYKNQAIDVESLENARQLGGYVCKDGRKIRDGVLFRSGALGWISDEDAEKLAKKYKIKYIVDFRTEEEVTDAPDKEISGAEHIWIPVYGKDLYDDETKELLGKIEPKSDNPLDTDAAYAENRIITRKYKNILLSEYAQKAYSQFFDVLLDMDEGEAVLWHCSKGKDRTGLASALLLYALGADESAVVNDFVLSNDFFAADIEDMEKEAKKYGFSGNTAEEFVASTAGVGEKYLKMAIDSVEEKYGSVHNYLNKQLKLSDSDMQKLQEKFLDD